MSREKKYVYRWRLTNAFQIGETESWLADMAEKGYHLDRVGFWKFRFLVGEPEKVRYRMEMAPDSEALSLEEQRQIYSEYGWEYAAKFGMFCVYRSPEASGAPEIHTDPAEQGITLEGLKKRLNITAAFMTIASILVIAMFCAIWFMGTTPVIDLVEGRMIQQILLVVVYIYMIANSIWEAVSLRALCARLKEGGTIDHRADWRKQRKHGGAILATILILEIPILLVTVIELPQLINQKHISLNEASADAPVLRLADVERNPELTWEEDAGVAEWKKYDNTYTFRWSMLASGIYETQENGEVPGVMWKDGSGTYSPSMDTNIYQLRLSALAKPLAVELVSRYDNLERARMGNGSVEEITDDSRFDYLMLVKMNGRTEVAAVKERTVIYLRYYGFTQANQILDAVAAKF